MTGALFRKRGQVVVGTLSNLTPPNVCFKGTLIDNTIKNSRVVEVIVDYKNGRWVDSLHDIRERVPELHLKNVTRNPIGNEGLLDAAFNVCWKYLADETPGDCAPITPTAENIYVFPGKDKLIQDFADENGVGSFSLPDSLLLDTVQENKSYSEALGHRYTTVSKLGASDLCPEDVMNEIKKNPDRVFPIFTAVGRKGQPLVLHNIYDLNLRLFGADLQNNPVEVIQVNKFSFTFSTLPNHMLVGTATHGIIKDRNGVLWMFQEGIGAPGKESFFRIYMNYKASDELWARMAWDTRQIIRELEAVTKRTGCGCGSSSRVIQNSSKATNQTSLPNAQPAQTPTPEPTPSPEKRTGVKGKMKDIWRKMKPSNQ
jgi:hypothetical protein